MRKRIILLGGVALGCLTMLTAVLYVWKSWPRRDLVGEQTVQAARDVGRSTNTREFERRARRWWRKFRRQVRRKPYPLDERSRVAVKVPGRGLRCPEVELVTYRGETLGYKRPVKINKHFRAHLERFEEIAARVGREVYGRPPSRIIHFGTYNCRTLRMRKFVLSEHAFGNAIDVAGFEFDALPGRKEELGKAAEAFEVSVLFHWKLGRGFQRKHAVFLRSLARELERDRVFRGMLVPPAPGHDDHFHLDMGWWIYFNGDPSFDEDA